MCAYSIIEVQTKHGTYTPVTTCAPQDMDILCDHSLQTATLSSLSVLYVYYPEKLR